MSEKRVGKFKLRNGEYLCVALVGWRGQQFLDVRRWYVGTAGSLMPGRQGWRIPRTQISLLRKLLKKAARHINLEKPTWQL